MKVVCSTLPFRNWPIREALKKMALLGIRSVELCTDPLHSDAARWPLSKEDVVQLIERFNIRVHSIHVPNVEFTGAVQSPEFRKIWTHATKKTIDLASFFGAEFVVQHVRLAEASAQGGGRVPAETMIPDLNAALAYAAEKNIRLALENVPSAADRMLGATIDEMVGVVESFDSEWLGICLDVNHCLAAGFDPMDAAEAIDVRRLISIHASDNLYGKPEDRHLPIGRGDIPWKPFLKLLKKKGFEGAWVVEVSGIGGAGTALSESLAFIHRMGIAAGLTP